MKNIIFITIFFSLLLFAKEDKVYSFDSQEYSINNYGSFILSKDKKSFYSMDPFRLYQLKQIDINTTKVIAKYRRYKDIYLESEDEKLVKKLFPKLSKEGDLVYCVDRSNSIIYYATKRNEIVSYDYAKKKEIFKTKTLFEVGEYSKIEAMKLGRDAKSLISGFDSDLVVFDIESQKVYYFGKVRISVSALALSPDFHYIVASGLSGDMKVYDYNSLELLKKLQVDALGLKESLHSSINSIEFIDNDRVLYASSLEGVGLISVSSGKLLRSYSEKKVSPLIGLRGDIAHFISINATIYNYNLKKEKFIEVYEVPLREIKRVLSDKKNTLILSQKNGDFIYYNLKTNIYEDYNVSFREHYAASFAMHPTKKQFARVSSNNAFQVFDVLTGKELVRIENKMFDTPEVFSYLDDRVVIYSSDFCKYANKAPLQFIDTKTKRVYGKSEHLDTVVSYEISKDKRFLITASSDRTIKLWSLNLKNLMKTRVLDTIYTDNISYSISLSDNETKLLISTENGDLYLWGLSLEQKKFTSFLKVIEGTKPTKKIQRVRNDDERFDTGFNTTTTKYYSLNFYDNDTKIVAENSERNFIFYDLKSGKELYKLLLFGQRDWVKLLADGTYESSKNGYKYIDDKLYDIFVEDKVVLRDVNESYEKEETSFTQEQEENSSINWDFVQSMLMVLVSLLLFMKVTDWLFEYKWGRK